MAKVVYTDWKDRAEEPEIIGVFESDDDGYRARSSKDDELKEEGYDTDEEVRVWIEDVDIVRDEEMSESEIELVMNALAGHPTVTSARFADKVERILRKYLGNEEAESNE